ncbi:hypothetical protein HELRODRAFT_183447 [Helobdella robusta]|uniref:Class I SAM-dependent methyltransferase n=1 Tax=Helobdella robusta TaxID=6412 RepID=T1FJP1_HELRO|nr:hypothetical protein HELRODRAFT_183447 [Helobdella robusta]ESO11207.1 hypothetical protein HELRODRAFT_183447 [Helobdella robusta]
MKSRNNINHVCLTVFFLVTIFIIYYNIFERAGEPSISVINELPFVPNNLKFTCDDLFIGTALDKFNFSKKYYEDLPAFTAEVSKHGWSEDGHTAMFPTEHLALHFLASREFVRSVCETGFNYGHSSYTFMTARSGNKILSFDIGHHAYTSVIMSYLNRTYPGRFEGVLGDSSITLPKFVKEHPNHRCNLFFVDGSHTYKIGYSDLKSFSKISDKNNIIVFDDFPTLDGSFTNELGRAWEQAKSEKMIVEIMRCTRKEDKIRGFTVGKDAPDLSLPSPPGPDLAGFKIQKPAGAGF